MVLERCNTWMYSANMVGLKNSSYILLCQLYGARDTNYYASLSDHMYVRDARFKQYYDNVADGAAEFLRDAIHAYWQV